MRIYLLQRRVRVYNALQVEFIISLLDRSGGEIRRRLHVALGYIAALSCAPARGVPQRTGATHLPK